MSKEIIIDKKYHGSEYSGSLTCRECGVELGDVRLIDGKLWVCSSISRSPIWDLRADKVIWRKLSLTVSGSEVRARED